MPAVACWRFPSACCFWWMSSSSAVFFLLALVKTKKLVLPSRASMTTTKMTSRIPNFIASSGTMAVKGLLVLQRDRRGAVVADRGRVQVHLRLGIERHLDLELAHLLALVLADEFIGEEQVDFM